MALGRTIFQSLVVLRQPGTWGSFAAMLAPGQTSPPATKHKETVGVEIIMCISSWSKFWTKKYKKTKNPTATSKVSGAKAESCSHPLHTTPRSGWADHPGHLSGLTLGPATALTHLRNQLTRLLGERAGHPSLVPPLHCSTSPSKAPPEFLT